MDFNFDVTVGCPDGRELRFNCPPNTTVGMLRVWCCKEFGVEADGFLLKYDGRVLRLDRPVDQEGLPEEATIQLVKSEDCRTHEQKEMEGRSVALDRPGGTVYDRGNVRFGEDGEEEEAGERQGGEDITKESLPALIGQLTNIIQSQAGFLASAAAQHAQSLALLSKISAAASSSAMPLTAQPLAAQPLIQMSDEEAQKFDVPARNIHLRARHAEDDLVLETDATAKIATEDEWNAMTHGQRLPFLCRAKRLEELMKKKKKSE